jgi:hypothetical protein
MGAQHVNKKTKLILPPSLRLGGGNGMARFIYDYFIAVKSIWTVKFTMPEKGDLGVHTPPTTSVLKNAI